MVRTYTKTQAKKAYKDIRTKASKICYGNVPGTVRMSSKDFMAIDANVTKLLKKF